MKSEPEYDADRAFVERVLRGDGLARRLFVERMGVVGRVLSSRNRRAGRPFGPDELAELAQQVTLLVWSKLPTYAARASFETWVYRFCYFEFQNAVRRQTRQRNVDALPEDVPEGLVDETGDAEDSALERLVRHLTAREAEVVRLVHVAGCSLPEAAQRLDVSVSTAKTLYYRSLKKLRAVLGEGHREEGTA